MSDFWIGDWVRDEKTNRYGTFEGNEGSLARVKIDHKIQLFPENQLTLMTDKEVEAARINQQLRYKSQGKIKKPNHVIFEKEIDLHIEKLAPHLKGKQVELILKKQIGTAKEFVQNAISNNQLTITIIHGKGTGALKMEIEHLLEDFEEVFFTKPVNNGGGVEVWFRYL